jgi:hypothetical protein
MRPISRELTREQAVHEVAEMLRHPPASGCVTLADDGYRHVPAAWAGWWRPTCCTCCTCSATGRPRTMSAILAAQHQEKVTPDPPCRSCGRCDQ